MGERFEDEGSTPEMRELGETVQRARDLYGGSLQRPKKTGGDLRQTNQFDQRLWSGINAAADASSYRPAGTSCEAISIFTI
jgi:hypothetical protein